MDGLQLSVSACWSAGMLVAAAAGPSGLGSAISAPIPQVPGALWLFAQESDVSSAMAVITFLAKGRAPILGVSVTTFGALCVGVCCNGILMYG